MDALLIILSAYLCRMTGSDYRVLPSLQWKGEDIGNGEWKILFGWVVAALYGHEFDYLTIGIIVTFFIGEVWGWGEPIGAALTRRDMNELELEGFQIGILKQRPWLAIAVRGLIWGAPVAALAWFDPLLLTLPFILMLAMPLGVLAAKYLPGSVDKKWTYQEIVRGSLLGLAIYAVTLI